MTSSLRRSVSARHFQAVPMRIYALPSFLSVVKDNPYYCFARSLPMLTAVLAAQTFLVMVASWALQPLQGADEG